MPSYVVLNPASGGASIKTDELAGSIHAPVSKIVLGAAGADDGFVSAANPLPVAVDGTVPVSVAATLDVAVGRNTTPVAGTLAATTAAQALGSQACDQVLVQNDPDNTVDVLVGGSASQVIQLAPGQAVTVPAANVSAVYAKTVSGTATVNWLAMT